MNQSSNCLYIDMDGVVADFNGFAAQILRTTKIKDSNEAWSESEWNQLKSYPSLYAVLPKTELADRIVETALKFKEYLGWDVYFLTAVPKANDVPDAFHDKINWAEKYYPSVRVRFGPFAKNKKEHCKPNDILIDDRISNCNEWVQAGGRAIQATDLDRALAELKLVFERERLKNP